jgi:hypothetical protein
MWQQVPNQKQGGSEELEENFFENQKLSNFIEETFI